MKSLTAVRKKANYPVEFKIKMVELSHRPEIREHGVNDNLLFKKARARPPSTTVSVVSAPSGRSDILRG